MLHTLRDILNKSYCLLVAFYIGSKLFTLTESLTNSGYEVIVISEIAVEINGDNEILYRILASE